MSCPITEVSVKDLRRTHFEQLYKYIREHDTNEEYYGNKKYFDIRHSELREWVRGILRRYEREEEIEVNMDRAVRKYRTVDKVKIMVDNMLSQYEIDYSGSTEKPLLKPQNNREYWLFTETHQMLKDFQKEINGLL